MSQYHALRKVSRANDSSYLKFGTSAGRKDFGLFGKFWSFFSAAMKQVVVILTSDSAAVAIDASLGNIWYHLTTENTTLAAPSNMEAGAIYVLHMVQDTSAAKTLAFNAVFLLVGGAFTITASTDAVDMLVFYCDGTNMLEISRSQNLS